VRLYHTKVYVFTFHMIYSMLMSPRTAAYKALTIAGTISSSVAYALLIMLWHGKTNIWESLYIGPGGLGTGIVLATTFVSLAAGVAESEIAISSTGLYLSTNIGCLVGASLASTVLQTSLRNELGERLKGFPNRDSVRLFQASAIYTCMIE
jgi:hypothetical protein